MAVCVLSGSEETAKNIPDIKKCQSSKLFTGEQFYTKLHKNQAGPK